jgi:hypothetical protein
MLNKIAFSKFWLGDFGEKMSMGGGQVVLQFCGYLKRALELLIFPSDEPFQDILWLQDQYDGPWEIQKKTTTKNK